MRVEREKLLQALLSVAPGVSKDPTSEQSDCVAFKDNHLVTFNGEISCRCEFSLDLEGVVEAAPLISLLAGLQEEHLEITAENKKLVVRGGGIAKLPMQAEITMPLDALETPGKWIKLPEEFADAIGLVEHCASRNEDEFNLACVHIHPKWIEASDRFQIARFKMETGLEAPILVRRNSIKHITTAGVTRFSETAKWIHFKSPVGLTISCRRFEDDYPKLTQILKTEGDLISLPKGITQAAKIAKIFTSKSDEDKVLVTLSPGKLKITGDGPSGEYTKTNKLVYSGDRMSFMIAPELLINLANKYNDFEVSKGKLKINGGKFVYLTCLRHVEDE